MSSSGQTDQEKIEELSARLVEWFTSTGLGTRSLWALESGIKAMETPGVGLRLEILVPPKVTDRGDIRLVMVE